MSSQSGEPTPRDTRALMQALERLHQRLLDEAQSLLVTL